MKPRQLSRIVWRVLTGILFLPVSLVAQNNLSHVRVVRLSYASGTVGVKRPRSTEWVKATVNTPIQEGFALSTSSNSFAEVEFENGSTARLGELSEVDFTQLAMDSAGNKINHLVFEGGYATFRFLPEHKDVYTVKAVDVTVSPHTKSEFRTELETDQLRVEVFNGSVEIVAPSGSTRLGRDEALTFNTRTKVASNIQHGYQKDEWDKWVESRDTQALLAQKDSAVGLKGSLYGWSDLDTYGDWAYFPGYGYGWAPYEPMGWSPYSVGMWDWYSPFGWTWIGGEPWGWLPYHYGLWNYDAMFGWFWIPGSFGMWSPALVNWYAGPGWIGWLPAGCQYGTGITAVSTAALQSSGLISPHHLIPVHSWEGRRLTSQPSFQPHQETMLSGVPLAHNHISLSLAQPEHSLPLQASFRSRPGPVTVLMGGSPSSERTLLNSHQSFWARTFGGSQPQPLRARLGAALGGVRPVGGVDLTNFETLRGSPTGEKGTFPLGNQRIVTTLGFAGSGPVVLPHGGGGFSRAAVSSQGGFGGRMGGGGGFSSASSGHVSSGIASGGHSASGGGGHR